MTYTFSIPTQVIFGAGAAKEAGSHLQNLIPARQKAGKSGVLVIVDPGVSQAAWLADILSSLKENKIDYKLFNQVRPNPRDADVAVAARMVVAEGLIAIIAIGGGSTMDTAKGASLLATHGGTLQDYAGWGKVPGEVLPVAAIPTTAGSGSEATSWAVITDSASHAKMAIGDRHLTPASALVDPLLTLSLPARLTAATGMDVLTHAIEAYLCSLSNPINDLLALEAIRLVATHLPAAVEHGNDLSAREGMMLASTLGGIAINNADVAGVHCLSESMGSLYDAPHGLMNAILLSYFMRFWQSGNPERMAAIALAFNAEPDPGEAVRQVIRLSRQLGFTSLVELGIDPEDLPKLAKLAEANVSNSSNPVPMDADAYLVILNQAMKGELHE
jgi:alcohol dehydrogenase